MSAQKRIRRAWKASRRVSVAEVLAWDMLVENALERGDKLTLVRLVEHAEENVRAGQS